jgi:arylformamidase
MQIYDVSIPLSSGTPTYPGDPGIEITSWTKLDNGDAANVSLISFGLHTGTHVDAPSHFIAGGGKVDSLPIDSLLGAAQVVEVPTQLEAIDRKFVESNCTSGATRILFKTRNSSFWANPERGFREDFVYIEPDAAEWLVQAGIKLVGIDYLSVERFKSVVFATHLAFLSHGVVILEGLDLREVPAGNYELICLPLKIAGGTGDGAPARVVLRSLE